jgi:glucokinase
MTDAPNLVADLGGTNTRVALADGPALRDGSIRRFRNADHAGLDAAGISLVGGVSRAFAPWLVDFGFAEAFRDKGRFSEFMEQFGVQVVTDDYAALTGCASFLAKL